MISKRLLKEMEASPAVFRNHLLIDADGDAVPLATRMDPWQVEACRKLDPAWKRLAGLLVAAAASILSRLWVELCRGSGKTTFAAVMIVWILAFSKRTVHIVAAAVDKNQAAILLACISTIVRLNPWLVDVIDVQATKVVGRRRGSVLEILSSDVPGSFGRTPDAIILDEVAMWPRPDLWDSLISSAAKRRDSVIVVLTNAGFRESWVWTIREAVRNDPNWHFEANKDPASWMSPKHLAEQRRLLPERVFRRLFCNEWCDSNGDALNDEDLDAVTMPGGPDVGPKAGCTYLLGLDLGTRRDHSALILVAIDRSMCCIRLAGVWSWAPVNGRVSIMEVEKTILAVHQRFHVHSLSFDPWQSELLAERVRLIGLPAVPVPFVGSTLNKMAGALLQVVRERKLLLYPDDELIRDLKKLRIVEKSFGWKLEAPSGPDGHCDRAYALAVVLPTAADLLASLTRGEPGKIEGYRSIADPRDRGVQLQRPRDRHRIAQQRNWRPISGRGPSRLGGLGSF